MTSVKNSQKKLSLVWNRSVSIVLLLIGFVVLFFSSAPRNVGKTTTGLFGTPIANADAPSCASSSDSMACGGDSAGSGSSAGSGCDSGSSGCDGK